MPFLRRAPPISSQHTRICKPSDLAGLPRHTRIAGLDVGARKIGVALSDPGRRIASPAGVVRRSKRFYDTAEALAKLWRGEAVSGIVVGMPLNQDGSQGPRAQASRQFAHNLARHFDIPVALWDERFSSVAAERLLLEEADLSRTRRQELVDQTAAAFILQGCLDYLISPPAAEEDEVDNEDAEVWDAEEDDAGWDDAGGDNEEDGNEPEDGRGPA